MKVLPVINLIFVLAGISLLVMAYRERNREFPWFSFRLAAFRGNRRDRFTEKGFKYYLPGVSILVVGCLSGYFYWTYV